MEFQCSPSVEVSQGMTIRGPRCKNSESPLLIWPPPEQAENGMQFFLVQTSCEWLCRFLSGQRASQRPLGRFSCWAVSKAAMAQAEQEHVEKDRAAGVDILEDSATKKKRRVVRGKASAILEITVPDGPGSENLVTLQAMRKARSVYLAVAPASFSWMLGWCDAEIAKPKRTTPSTAEKSNTPNVFWSRTEQSWVCRGPVRTKKFRVQSVGPSGEQIQGESYKRLFLAQKEFALQELHRQTHGQLVEGGGAPECAGEDSPEDSVAVVSSVETSFGASASISSEVTEDEMPPNADAESFNDFSTFLSM
jgi:hypothetical protein